MPVKYDVRWVRRSDRAGGLCARFAEYAKKPRAKTKGTRSEHKHAQKGSGAQHQQASKNEKMNCIPMS
jgi:hypothetical protein